MPTYTVTYKIAGESAPRTLEIDAPDEAGAREVFAAQHPEHTILMVKEGALANASGPGAPATPSASRVAKTHVSDMTQEQLRQTITAGVCRGALIAGAIMVAINFLLLMLLIAMNSGA